MQRNLEIWTQGTSHLYCCAFASSPASTHPFESEVFKVKSAAEVNSQGHPSATFIARATMASAHDAARGSSAVALAWKGQRRSVTVTSAA